MKFMNQTIFTLKSPTKGSNCCCLMQTSLVMSVIAVLSVNMVTANMLLSVFWLSGALVACPQESALNITAPKVMNALSGSCLQIPCSFSAKPQKDFDSTREIFGVWIKNNSNILMYPDNVIFNSSKTVNIYPMNFTGNLSQRNCTTLFSNLLTSYTDTYYFRIENWPYKATASCDSLQITVQDSPLSPRIEIPGDLKEKQSVTITCSAFTPCPYSPPTLTWDLQQHSDNTVEENTDGTFTTKIQATITLSDQNDGYNISCSATYPVNETQTNKTAVETKSLSVSYAPKNTSVSISPSGLVSAGSWVNLTCSSRAKPPVSCFTWFKNSKDGPKNVSEGALYSFNLTVGGVYYCVATNNLGNQTSSEIHLNIEEAESSFQWEAVLGGIIGIIALFCLIVCVVVLKSKYQTTQQTQRPTGKELDVEDSSSKTEKDEEDIHYGEIDFSKQRPGPSSESAQDSGQQQDTLYAQVKVSQPANSLTQTADGPEDVYAQVKK